MQRSALLALIGAVLLLSAGTAAAAGDITQGNEMNGLLRMLYDAASEWSPRLQGYALTLLASLALIQLVWTFMPLVMKQADFGEIVGELIRFFMAIGFFYAIIEHSVPWATAVVDSFREAAGTASGLGRALQPGDMFAVAVDFSRTIVEGISVFSPGKAVLIALVGCLVLLCFAFIAAFMFVTLVESYVIINASVLFFGFGGSQWTRDFAIAPLRFVIAVGAKLFVLTLIVGIIVTSAKSWLAAYTNDEASLMTLAGLALVCAYLTKTIPELIGGMISGTSMGGGSAIGGMAAAGAAGAAAAIATIATAGAAAPAAAGALGAAGSGSAAGAGAAGAGGLAAAVWRPRSIPALPVVVRPPQPHQVAGRPLASARALAVKRRPRARRRQVPEWAAAAHHKRRAQRRSSLTAAYSRPPSRPGSPRRSMTTKTSKRHQKGELSAPATHFPKRPMVAQRCSA